MDRDLDRLFERAAEGMKVPPGDAASIRERGDKSRLYRGVAVAALLAVLLGGSTWGLTRPGARTMDPLPPASENEDEVFLAYEGRGGYSGGQHQRLEIRESGAATIIQLAGNEVPQETFRSSFRLTDAQMNDLRERLSESEWPGAGEEVDYGGYAADGYFYSVSHAGGVVRSGGTPDDPTWLKSLFKKLREIIVIGEPFLVYEVKVEYTSFYQRLEIDESGAAELTIRPIRRDPEKPQTTTWESFHLNQDQMSRLRTLLEDSPWPGPGEAVHSEGGGFDGATLTVEHRGGIASTSTGADDPPWLREILNELDSVAARPSPEEEQESFLVYKVTGGWGIDRHLELDESGAATLRIRDGSGSKTLHFQLSEGQMVTLREDLERSPWPGPGEVIDRANPHVLDGVLYSLKHDGAIVKSGTASNDPPWLASLYDRLTRIIESRMLNR